jgi:hypothetical protein
VTPYKDILDNLTSTGPYKTVTIKKGSSIGSSITELTVKKNKMPSPEKILFYIVAAVISLFVIICVIF